MLANPALSAVKNRDPLGLKRLQARALQLAGTANQLLGCLSIGPALVPQALRTMHLSPARLPHPCRC